MPAEPCLGPAPGQHRGGEDPDPLQRVLRGRPDARGNAPLSRTRGSAGEDGRKNLAVDIAAGEDDAAAKAAAPAPSATLCVSVKRWRIAARISPSVTASMRSAPRRIAASAASSGTRQASPSAMVSALFVATALPAAKERA